jgi:hypothetical protein
MSQSAKKRSSGPRGAASVAAKPLQRDMDASTTAKANSSSKQSRVIAMLQSSAGATIAAMMKATAWQQHSVRGFLAGVVRKRLKLKLDSAKVDGARVYRIASVSTGKARARSTVRRAR